MNCLVVVAAASMAFGICAASVADAAQNASLDRLVATAARGGADPQLRRVHELAVASLPSLRNKVIVGAIEPGGFHQTIELDRSVSGLSPNMIDIHYRRSIDGGDQAAIQSPTESGIRNELATRFPNMAMLVVAQPRRNAYGIYGLAVGKWANGTNCVYAWQWADNDDTRNVADSRDALSLRISLCRSGATLDDLATTIDGLRLGPATVKPAAGAASQAAARPSPSRRASSQIARRIPAPRGAQATTMAQYDPAGPSVVQQSVPGAGELPLDPSLPAAAYLGPNARAPIQTVLQ